MRHLQFSPVSAPASDIFIVVQLLWMEGSRMGVVRTVGARVAAGGGRDGRALIMVNDFSIREKL